MTVTTVRELIQHLNTFDGDTICLVDDGVYLYDICNVRVARVYRDITEYGERYSYSPTEQLEAVVLG